MSSRARALLLFVSAASYLASFSDASGPLEARMLPADRALLVEVKGSGPQPALAAVIRRDPFVGMPVANDGRRTTRTTPVIAGDFDPVVPDIDPNAPDALAAVGTTAETVRVAVRATIAGARPVAYVAEGSQLQIVRIGDIVAGRRVTAIDLRGVALSDGSRVDLPETYLAAGQSVSSRPTELEAPTQFVRSRDVSRERATSADAPVPAATAIPTVPSPASEALTPAPLRTVDARGLSVGVNPTPDAIDPTAYPYPYPYPPHR